MNTFARLFPSIWPTLAFVLLINLNCMLFFPLKITSCVRVEAKLFESLNPPLSASLAKQCVKLPC